MREFRIKVNNEKTYVVKANDYNQAVKTLHSKLRDFDDTKKNINVVREFITNNGGKFSKSKDADAILDFIYKKTGVKNADYGDVLYIVRNYTNVKVDDNTINDKPIKKWVLQSTINPMLYLDEDKVAVPGAYRGKQFITKSDAEKWYYSMMSEPLGSKNATFKVVEAVVANDSSINDLVSKYNGENAIRTNGFVKIKEDGDWTSYKYNGSDFDDAVFKIHQYNPSLIAFVSNGNETITVRNKYLNDDDSTAQGEIEVLKSFGFDYKDGRWVKESNNNDIIVQPDYHYVSVIGPGDTEKHCKKYQYQSAGMLKKIIASNIKDSSIKDDLTMVETYKKSIIYIDDNGYYYHTPIGGRGAKAQKDNTKDINIVKKRIDNDYSFLYDSSIKDISIANEPILDGLTKKDKFYTIGTKIKEGNKILTVVKVDDRYIYLKHPDGKVYAYDPYDLYMNLKMTPNWSYVDSSIKDVSYVSGKNLKIGQKIVEDGEVLEVVDIKETQRGINNDYRDVTFKNIKTGATETTHFGNKTLARLTDKLIESGSKEALSKNIATEIKAGKDPKQAAAIAYSVQRENDASTGYKYRITNNGSKWYYETTFPDGHTTLTGPYSSKQETEQYFHKHRPTEKLTDADPVKVEKIIRKEKSALGVTYYIFQTKSSSGYTIYYQVTDRTYHGEPTYSGGGIISLSLKSANDTLDHNLLSDKLKAKYGEKEGTKRYLRGENDSAIKDSNIKDAGEEIRYLEGMKFNGVPYTGWAVQHWTDGYYTFDGKKPYIPFGGRDALLSIFKQGGFIGQWKGIKPDKGFESYFRHSTAVPAVRDSNNIKNRKSYTIKVGDKQYKVFAESESEAINKYIKSKKQ